MVRSKLSYKNLLNLKNLIHDKEFFKNNSDWKALNDNEFDSILVDLFLYLAESANSFKLKTYKYDEEAPIERISQNDRSISILIFILQITHNITQNQFYDKELSIFIQKLFDKKLLEYLLEFLKQQEFLNEYNRELDFHQLIVSVLKIMRNLSENNKLDKNVWIQLDVENKLKEFGQVCRCEMLYNKELDLILTNLNIKTVEKCISNIKFLKEPEKILNVNMSYGDFLYLSKQVRKSTFDKHEMLMAKDCQEIFKNLLQHFLTYKNELDFEDQVIELYYPKKSLNSKEKKISIFYYLLTVINATFEYQVRKKRILIYSIVNILKFIYNFYKIKDL